MLLPIIIYGIIFGSLIGFAELLFHKFKREGEVTRKIVHFGSGIISLTFPMFLYEHWQVIVLILPFAIALWATRNSKKWFQSIHAVQRKTRGSFIFPLIIYFCFAMYEWQELYVFYYLPILILAICDPLAALVGKRWGFGPYKIVTNTKTLAGNLACFISAYILCAGIGYMEFREIINPFGAAAIVAFIATVGEGITSRGYDNVVIPLSITGTLLVMRHMVDSGMI